MFGHVAEKCAVKIPFFCFPYKPRAMTANERRGEKKRRELCTTETRIVIMSSGYWYRYPRLKIDTMRKVRFFFVVKSSMF